MIRYEKEEIKQLPKEYRPIGAWSYFGYRFLFSIPVIGWLAWLIIALVGKNVNARSFARSYLCNLLFEIILLIILAIFVAWFYSSGWAEYLYNQLAQYFQTQPVE